MKRTFWSTLALLFIVVVWYLAADRITPFTSNARVKAIITPITPQVSGTVIEINAGNGEIVEAGTVIARIDPRQFEIQKQSAEADLERATQDVGADSADGSGCCALCASCPRACLSAASAAARALSAAAALAASARCSMPRIAARSVPPALSDRRV